nr:hypothetical protein [uncultured Noviherbaspirillum sp.]
MNITVLSSAAATFADPAAKASVWPGVAAGVGAIDAPCAQGEEAGKHDINVTSMAPRQRPTTRMVDLSANAADWPNHRPAMAR